MDDGSKLIEAMERARDEIRVIVAEKARPQRPKPATPPRPVSCDFRDAGPTPLAIVLGVLAFLAGIAAFTIFGGRATP